MVTTCAQLVNDNVEAAADAAKSDAVASSAMEISSVRLEKLKANSVKTRTNSRTWDDLQITASPRAAMQVQQRGHEHLDVFVLILVVPWVNLKSTMILEEVTKLMPHEGA